MFKSTKSDKFDNILWDFENILTYKMLKGLLNGNSACLLKKPFNKI